MCTSVGGVISTQMCGHGVLNGQHPVGLVGRDFT